KGFNPNYADGHITLSNFDAGLNGYHTAHVEFTALTTIVNSITYQYRIGDVWMNVKDPGGPSITVNNLPLGGALTGNNPNFNLFSPQDKQPGANLGDYNIQAEVTGDSKGYKATVTSISFDITLGTGGVWADAFQILQLNDQNH